MDKRISELTALGAAPATNDLLVLVDVSDTTDASSGTTKKMTVANFIAGLSTWTKETPSGVFDGVNLTYSLAHTVIANTFSLIVNGQEYTEGVDYSITGLSLNVLTLVTALPAGYTGPFIAKYAY